MLEHYLGHTPTHPSNTTGAQPEFPGFGATCVGGVMERCGDTFPHCAGPADTDTAAWCKCASHATWLAFSTEWVK